MIKLTFCLTRLPHLSVDEFQDYWWNKHAPLVKSHRAALRIKRYVQMHSLPVELSDGLREGRGSGLENAPAIYDGVAQLWWESAGDLLAVLETEEGLNASRALYEDESSFIDFRKSPLWLGEEKVVFE